MTLAARASSDRDDDKVSAPALYVYGFVRSGAVRALHARGVGDAGITMVGGGDVAAIVSPVRRAELRLKRRDLHRHLQVIESAFERTTILPCPFGTIVDSKADLEDGVLVSARDDLLAGLSQLEGKVQMNVKAVYDEEVLLREILATDRRVAALRERTRESGDAGYYDRLRLGELVAARITERAELDSGRLTRALAKNAADVVVEPLETGIALKASFLVLRKSLDRFDATLEALARDEQPLLRFEAIGPLPPTAFAAAYAST